MFVIVVSAPTASPPARRARSTFRRRVKDCFESLSPDVRLQPDIRRNHIDDITSFRDDGMDPDRILVLKRLSLGMNREDAQTCGIEGIDPFMGNGARMSRFSLVLDELGQKAIPRPIHQERGSRVCWETNGPSWPCQCRRNSPV